MRTYAIADLHGRFDLLAEAQQVIRRHHAANFRGEDRTIVVMGDFVDRGPDSAKIISFLRIVQAEGEHIKWVVLKGNHEDMMVQCLRREAQLRWWIGNGGGQTLISYGYKDGDQVYPLKGSLRDDLIWLASLPIMHVTEKQVFVHAHVDPNKPLDQQKDELCMWRCYDHGQPHFEDNGDHIDAGYPGKHVVHGHEQWAHGPILKEGRTDLDTFAWYTGRLAIGVFDDTQGKPTEILWAEGEPYVH